MNKAILLEKEQLMKRFSILLCIVLVFSTPLFADTSTLIDFAVLTADRQDGNNEATLLDFSANVGTTYTEEEKAFMVTSLAIENWEIVLVSSSRSIFNQSRSFTLEAPTKSGATRYDGETLMGIRIHFPVDPYNSNAVVKPPFEIPMYMKADENDLTGSKYDGLGVVKNVGVIKSITANIYGLNFPHGFGILLTDQNNVEHSFFMDYLDFEGWKTITWNNPNYVVEVRHRELKRFPLYPKSEPAYKLSGLIFYRDSAAEGGNFVTYIKDIIITYDLAVLKRARDFEDEALWGILQERENARRNAEFRRLGDVQVLRYLEQQKMDAGEGTTE
jgi:hypothetical protein